MRVHDDIVTFFTAYLTVPLLVSLPGSNVFILFGFGLELVVQRFSIPNGVVVFFASLNLVGLVVFPTVVILAHDWNPCKKTSSTFQDVDLLHYK